MRKSIILFDMDGVLLEAHGYHRALQDTVEVISKSLGFNGFLLSSDHIAKFEASGVTNEWDSAAICTALLLKRAWEFDQSITLPKDVADLKDLNAKFPHPYIESFIRSIDLHGQQVLEFAEQVIVTDEISINNAKKGVLRYLLKNGREITKSISKRLFQEMVLGSAKFEEIYQVDSTLDTASYLMQYDKSVLSHNNYSLLSEWLSDKNHSATIFTNRPDNSLPEFFSTPEAEIGAQLVDLEMLPIVGSGSLSWAAQKYNESEPTYAYLKPSPIHALCALQLALGASLEQALEISIALVHGNITHQNWINLDQAHVMVIEDTYAGLVSAISAENLLNEIGIKLNVTLIGIAKHPSKAKTMRETGAQLYDDINLFIQKYITNINGRNQ